MLGKETGVIRRLKEVSPRTAIIALDTVGDLNHHEVKGVDITWELPVPSSSTIAEQLSTFIKPERKKNLVAQSNNTNRLVPPIPGGHRRNRSRSSTVGMYLTPLNELNRNVDYGKSASALVEELNISGQRQASDQTTNPPKAVAGLIKHSLSKSPVSARPRQHVQVFFPSHPATSNVKVALPLTPVKPEGVTRRVVFSDEIKKYDAKPNVSR